MSLKLQIDIKRKLASYCLIYQNEMKPISVNFRELVKDLDKNERYTHQIHPYPAKLLTQIPYYFLYTDALCPKDGIVLDPFCGTGTVLLEAVLSGRNALGADANPLASLISRVKTNYIPKADLQETLKKVLQRVNDTNVATSYPDAVSAWYSPRTLPQLSALQESIEMIEDEKKKTFFELCFSSVVRKVSYADPSISVPVHWNPKRFINNPKKMYEVESRLKSLESIDVFDRFEAVCQTNIDMIETLNGKIRSGVSAKIISDDARSLGLESNSVDMILTSPPYAGAQKYIRASWLSLYWLKLVELNEIKCLKRRNIGREDYKKSEIYECYTSIPSADEVLSIIYKKGKKDRAFLAANYLNEMKIALDEACRVLKVGGYMVIVIGNNTVCGQVFDTQSYLTTYLEGNGMQLQFKLIDDIKSYGLMTRRNKTANMITREWILVFKK